MLFFVQGNLKSWLLDKDCNDQYSVIYAGGQQVAIFQNKRNGPELIKSRPVRLYIYAVLCLCDHFYQSQSQSYCK